MASINIRTTSVGDVTIQSGNGTPNHIATKGSVYIDMNTAIQYINKDGIASWVEILDSSNVAGDYLPLSGGTVTGPSFFSGGLSAATFSATTYLGLPIDYEDYLPLSGGTVTGATIFTNGLTADTISATTYQNLPNDLPPSGTTGQILSKIDNADYNVEWIDNYASQLKHIVKAGEPINKGQAVYVSSASGTNMIVSKADYSSEATSSKTMGLLVQNLSTNGFGFIITEGLLTGTGAAPLNTNAGNAGDPVWLGANGDLIFGLTNKPIAPLHLVFIGIVTRKSTTVGEIFVKVQNGFELDELHNVRLTGQTYGDLLTFSAYNGSDVWVNSKTLTGDYTINGDLTITGDTLVQSGLSANTFSATTILSPTLDNLFYDEFMTNQYAYFYPSDGAALYDYLRGNGTLFSVGTVSALSENPMGVQYQTASAVGSVTALYGTIFGGNILGVNFQFEMIRKFRFGTTNSAQRFFAGLSAAYGVSAPTNIEPTSQINCIGVAKLQASNNLFFVWNDATGVASSLDLGVNFPANSTAYTYKLRIWKTLGVAAINLELTRITNSTGAVLVTTNTITSDYNTGSPAYPVAWMGNNTGASGAVSFKDYGCQLFKRNIIGA